jgi:SpoVK/Ycf46/Vps4 family AAA+-type ATPase
MFNTITIYKISLALVKKESRIAVNFKDMVDDLAGAKEEFNNLSGSDHRMLLLAPTSKRLNLLFKISQDNQPFQPDMLEPFFKILKDEFDWQDYCAADGRLFEVKLSHPVQRSEYSEYLQQIDKTNSNSQLGDAEMEKLLGRRSDRINALFSRRGRRSSEDQQPELSLQEALQQLDELIGFADLKAEVKKVITFLEKLHQNNKEIPAREAYPFHYICTTDAPGIGLSTALNLISTIFYHLEICLLNGYIEERVDSNRSFFFCHDFDENGVCALLDVNHLEHDSLEELFCKMSGEFKNQVIVLVVNEKFKKETVHLEQQMLSFGLSYRKFHFKQHSEAEYTAIFQKMLIPYGLPFSKAAEAKLIDLIALLEEKQRFCGAHTLKDLACKMAFELAAADDEDQARTLQTVNSNEIVLYLDKLINTDQTEAQQDEKPLSPLAELDSLVGLDAVKVRVKEILAHFTVEKEKTNLGIGGSDLCMHMLFTGDPGTGKTTVARIIGRVLKEEGLLKKGDLIEVSREDLISRYLGNTAPKTADVVKKSIGSVLFIDEAYSLDGGHDRDYGHEALATLVKLMEEHKNELVVIMAGYSEEMEKMVALNPGLTSRIPHQINFPDYNATELHQIFKLQLGADYTITEPAAVKLEQLFAKAATLKSAESGNGRFVRNLVERLKMKQGCRLLKDGQLGKEDFQNITEGDVDQVLADKDFAVYLQHLSKNSIGFG